MFLVSWLCVGTTSQREQPYVYVIPQGGLVLNIHVLVESYLGLSFTRTATFNFFHLMANGQSAKTAEAPHFFVKKFQSLSQIETVLEAMQFCP